MMWEQITTIVNAEPGVFAFNAVLLICEGISAGCVAAGIVWESAPSDTWKRRASHRLVIWGVVAEVAFSLALFISDEIVSGSQLLEIKEQQSKIITLDKEIAWRSLNAEQQQALGHLLTGFHGKSVLIDSYALDIEAAELGGQFINALTLASINPIDHRLCESAIGAVAPGIDISGSDGMLVNALLAAILLVSDIPATRGAVPPLNGISCGGQNAVGIDATIFIGVKPRGAQ